MSNPFSTNELLYPLTKGDIAGHSFHGNQYTSGTGDLARKLTNTLTDAYIGFSTGKIDRDQLRSYLTNGKDISESTILGGHKTVAGNHEQIAEDMGGGNNFASESDYKQFHNDNANSHEDAQQAHYDAVQAASDVVKLLDKPSSTDKQITDALETLVSASSGALVASVKADKTTPVGIR